MPRLRVEHKIHGLTLNKNNIIPKEARWTPFLQEFDHETDYRSGTQIKHVDVLNKNNNSHPIRQWINTKNKECIIRGRIHTSSKKMKIPDILQDILLILRNIARKII